MASLRLFRVLAAVTFGSFLLWSGGAVRGAEGTRAAPPQRETEVCDLIFFGPQGGVLLRLEVDTGTRGVTAIRREYTGVVLRSLDTDGDGRLNAEEAAKIPVGGQLAANTQPLGDAWKSLDVDPADGEVSVEELFPYVDQGLGKRFKVELKRRLQQSVRLTDPLDADGDEQISAEEIASGLGVLRGFDFDDDETLSVAELQPFPTAIRQALLQQQANEASELSVLPLATPTERSEAAQRLLRLYGEADVSGVIRVPVEKLACTAGRESEFSGGDGGYDADELGALLASPLPALELAVQLSRNFVHDPASTQVPALVSLQPRSREAPRRQQLVLAGMPVSVGASSNREGGMSDPQAATNLLLIKFLQLDVDKNRYLDQAEFGMLGLPGVEFAAVDRDSDGMVTRDELKGYMEVVFGLTQASLVLTITDDAKTLFEILDENFDNRLSPREFAEGYSRIRRYDYDRNGRLASNELRSQMGFMVAADRPESIAPSLVMQMQANPGVPRIRPMTSGPTWFRRMDRNQDGDVTWREFLGTRADFGRIDRDGDGLINVDEAVAATSESGP